MFVEEMNQFLYEIEKEKIKPVCQYYYETFLEYYEQIKNSREED